MIKVAIIDYGLGNIFSIQQALKSVGAQSYLTANPADIASADKIILPGVGAFGNAIEKLKELNLVNVIEMAVNDGKHLLGVCLGMQLLFDSSEEFGYHKGLGLISGEVIKFPEFAGEKKLRIPNIGWSRIVNIRDSKNLSDSLNGSYMYFVHSYYCKPKVDDDVLFQSHYESFSYCSAIEKDNILGVQFHPEKSGKKGLEFYKYFINK